MGLDMYLYAKIMLYSKKEEQEKIVKIFPELKKMIELRSVVGEVGYWRKQNAIHKWFVDKTQEGEDNCQASYVDIEQLRELREICEAVLRDISKAEKLLPTTSGFFFGNTEYDDWYKQGLKDTIEIVKKCEQLEKIYGYEVSFEYKASW